MPPVLFWARGLFAVLFFIVTFLTLTPNPEDTQSGFALARWVAVIVLGDSGLTDKVAHFMAYGALGVTAYWAQIYLFRRRWVLPVALTLYGAALEGAQGLGGVRSPELADAVANSLGVITAYGGAMTLAKIAKARSV